MDLLELVIKPTWKEFLIELVASNQMNPWEVDLIDVSDKYLEKVRQYQAMDLRIPANIILASALLLRFKAEAMQLEEEPLEELGAVEEAPQLINEEIPELVLRANKPRRRKLTLDELISAVEDVMKGKFRPIPRAANAPKMISINLPKLDMNELMKDVYTRSLQLKDEEGVVLFSELIKQSFTGEACAGEGNCQNHGIWCYGAENVVFTLLPLLHLTQDNKLTVWQDELFGEIFVKILPEQAENSNANAPTASATETQVAAVTVKAN